ncbi:Hsp70 family protein [Actinokineospora sp. NBRC 105648]|uniref:Hsp70 family protein n=1 Tax=Actinokineospora sp. NBRC 105648 TaxID=3032206 RepID=UPI0024A45275|nr:Hsp70 family protein [Actinokineospora sp. NBRC 105648]GLZ42322.1 molecular chaperone DnaK [Actinokineospora sp. NBRC 105648]
MTTTTTAGTTTAGTAARPFGIDLGTTHSCLAYIDDAGKPVVVRTVNGDETLPSVVYFEAPGQVTVGKAARNAAVAAPHLVSRLVKRKMGRVDAVETYHGRDYRPEEISALILRELVRATEENSGQVVREVVITVPAYFGVAERRATRRAGEIAGLVVRDVLAEPVSAALHYQSVGISDRVRHLLVCDLGGGTYDTTVLRLEGHEVHVVCTDGDLALGGADWDELIRADLVAQFAAAHPALDPTADLVFRQDVDELAEQLKRDLSHVQTKRVDLRFRGAVGKVELTRARLEELTAGLLDRVVEVTERTMAKARRAGVTEFDEVLLVGGMSKVPSVRTALRDRLGLRGRAFEPDLAVAKGAALYAVIDKLKVSGGPEEDSVRAVAAMLGADEERVRGLARTTVNTTVPRGFGVMGVDARDPVVLTDPLAARKMIVHLLPADTPLPADSGPFTFLTSVPNQRMVEIEVWEQTSPEESEDLADNVRIGRGLLKGIPAMPARSPLEVTFFMSATGELTVSATEPTSRAAVQFELHIGGMDEAELKRSTRDIGGFEVSG